MGDAQNRVSQTVGCEVGELAGAAGPVTYWQGFSGSVLDQRRRFDELADRDMMARAIAKLRADGSYDLRRHGAVSAYPLLTVAEHLELLALGEHIARYYRHPANVHQAVVAGASWQQIAAAVDAADAGQVRQVYRDWAERQHWLYQELGGAAGLDAVAYAAAVARAAEGSAP